MNDVSRDSRLIHRESCHPTAVDLKQKSYKRSMYKLRHFVTAVPCYKIIVDHVLIYVLKLKLPHSS